MVDAPVITLEPESAEVSAAGESGGFNYTIENPADDGAVSCEVRYEAGDAGEWVTCDAEDLEADGRINYTVEANEGEARTAYITVSYPGAEDVEFTISQAAAGASSEYDHEFVAQDFFGYFNDDMDGVGNYTIIMSDKPMTAEGAFPEGSNMYTFDIYTAGGTEGALPAGEYVLGAPGESVPGTVGYDWSSYAIMMADGGSDPVQFTEALMKVTIDGENQVYDVTLTDANGGTHHITYTGSEFPVAGEPSDEVNYDFEYSYLSFYEGGGENGEDNFFLTLSDMPFDADGYEADGSTVANFDIYAVAGTNEVLPEGTYSFDDYNYVAMTFSAASYILTPDREYIYFSDGSIEVTKSGDDYVFEATLTGSKDGKTYKVSYTGPIGDASGGDDPTDVTFDISVSNIGVNDFTYSIIPSDKSVTYFHAVVPKTLLEQSNVYVNGTLNEDALLAFDEQMWYPNLSSIYDMYVHQGDLVDASGSFSGEDVVYCYAFDPDSKTKLSPVTYIDVKEEEPVVVNFNVSDIAVRGTTISFYVDAQGYEGYWYPISIETAYTPENVMAYCESYMSEMVSYYSQYGYEYEDILSNFCYTGSGTAYAEGLYPNTEYTIVLAALTDNCQVSSIAASFNETTGVASENVIDINVTDITGSTALVNFTPSIKTEYYAYSVYLASALEGATDSDIMYSMLYSQSTGFAIDDYSARYGGLPASTELTVVAFGIDAYSMNPTTGLFKKNFTTTEAYSGDVEFNMEYDVYYDREASASAASASGYSDLADYLKSEDVAASGDALFILDVNTNPEDMLNVRYNIFSESQNEMSDDELIASVESEAYSAISGYKVLPYGSYFIAGLAYNDLGERGPLFRSEVFTLSPDGVSDPQGFIEFIYGPSTKSASSSVKAVPEISTIKSARGDADVLKVSSFSRQSRPLFKVSGK